MNLMWVLFTMCACCCALIGVCQAIKNKTEQRQRREGDELQRRFREYVLINENKSERTISIANVAVATDLLESSRLALDDAAVFANRYGAKLTIVHAFKLSPEAQEVEMLAHRSSISQEYMLRLRFCERWQTRLIIYYGNFRITKPRHPPTWR